MYQFVSALAKPRIATERWQSVNLSAMKLPDIYQKYSRVLVRLLNPVLTAHVTLDLEAVRNQAAGMDITFADWLVSLGNKTLPTTTTLYLLRPRYVKYADAIHAGYKAHPVFPGASAGSVYPKADMTELLLTKRGLSPTEFNQYCLVNVNGFFHRATASSAGVRVMDGNKSAQLSGVNHVGVLSFEDVGAIQILPITPSMLYKQAGDQQYKDRVFINAGTAVIGKIVMLVLGGYLHVLDDKVLTRVGDRTLRVALQNVPLLDRYYQSKKYIDMSSLGLSKNTTNPDQIGLDEFYSDEALAAYMTLSQSFLVLLTATDLFVERSYVRKTPTPGMYISYETPEFPLVVDAGKVANYWYTPEDGQYALSCHDVAQHNRLYDTIDVKNVPSITPARIPMKVAQPSHAFFMKIGSELSP